MASPTPDIDALLSSMTLEEKISLLAGKNFWETVDLPAKGVPSFKMSDGPNGARGAVLGNGPTAACFPASTSLASTWDVELARQIGNALAEETRTKGARALLGPTVCPHRHPLGGRNFESFSEDPLLAGKMAVGYINGLQEKGVAATIKHFAANEQETSRFTVNAVVSERALREIYLRPFEIAIKEANPWAVMTSYNLLNGVHADMNEFLLQKVLRGQWGWKGMVMSDWGGVNSTIESLQAGTDLEMPGPTKWRASSAVSAAVKEGKLSAEVIEQRARNVLDLLVKLKSFENPSIPPEQSINKPEHQALIRNAGARGIVLLKNENGILPLKKERLAKNKVALLGLAKEALIHGGGSASVNAHYRITPEEGLKAAFGDVEFVYSKGAHTFRQLPPFSKEVADADGTLGWTMKSFKTMDTSGPADSITFCEDPTYIPIFVDEAWQVIRATGIFTPTVSGSHYLALTGLGPSELCIDGVQVYSQNGNCADSMAFILGGIKETTVRHHFVAGRSYTIQVRTVASSPEGGFALLEEKIGFRLGFMREQDHNADVLSDAVAAAKDADGALVFTGHTPDWETEGQDQVSFHLPADGSQDRLVDAVAGANPNTVVVNCTGVAVAMPWIHKVKAVLQAWFPGQEAGNAIADVLVGKVNPEGRLPVSFPRRLEDAPAHGNFPGSEADGQLTVRYEEGIFVGYRHYDRGEKERNTVLFPFGHGLSYTTFDISDVEVQKVDQEPFDVSARVKNTGSVAGAEVVQLYAGRLDSASDNPRPVKELKAFAKVRLAPGEMKQVVLKMSRRDLAYFKEEEGVWVVEAGSYRLSIGRSVADVAGSKIIVIDQSASYEP